MIDDVLQGYASVSPEWIVRSEAISSEVLLKPVTDLLPSTPSAIIDIGAGTGRDAAWLAGKGHRVVAVEPVARFRQAGAELHTTENVTWLDDSLPELARLQSGERFDRVLLIGVWQHLNREQRNRAMQRLVELTAPGGMLILSLRHGPGALDRPVHQVWPEETISSATRLGFSLVREQGAESIQAVNLANGVRWTWLAFSL